MLINTSKELILHHVLNRDKTLQRWEKINKELLAAIREEMNYRMPSNYISWQVLSQVVAIGLATCSLDYAKVDMSAFYQSYRIALWFAQKAPMYLMTQEIIEAFDHTDAIRKPGIMCGWRPSLPIFLLAIPKGAISTPDGASIDYLTISCSDINHPEWNSAKWKGISINPFKLTYPLYFQCTTVDTHETVWTSGTGITEDGETLVYDESSDIGRNTLTPEDRVFIRRLRNLVINVLLTLEFLPSMVSEVDKKDLAVSSKGFGAPLRKSKAIDRFPRWLGKGFSISKSDSQLTEEILEVEETEEPTETGNTEIKRTHSSPTAHWRRGHWRVLESGEGKRWKNGKRIWIRPIYVNY